MTIILNGNTFKYEIESVCKLFFGWQLFDFEYENPCFAGDNVIIAKREICEGTAYLSAEVRMNSKVYKSGSTVECSESSKESYETNCELKLAVAVFRALKEATGIHPKWGVMTGIRPVKQLKYMLENGKNMEQAEQVFAQDYLVSKEKIELCKKTLSNQLPIIKMSNENSYSLYVSIPFCPSRCSYCSFVSSAISSKKAKDLVEPYLEKLCEEICYLGKITAELDLKLETVYIGGGTPTVLSAEQIKVLTDCMSENFPTDTASEYTIEAGRADTITKEKLMAIREAGATRISINPQSFNDDVIRAIGRNHTAKDVVDAYNMALDMGISDINMDLIAGLPGDTLEIFCKSIDTAVRLSPTNITVHTLTVKRSSDLFHAEDLDYSIDGRFVQDMMDYAYNTLTKNGYEPYYLYRQKNTLQNLENIGYCKKGYEGRYNIYTMEEVHSILAVGAGGVSKLTTQDTKKIERIFNYKYPFEYIRSFESILLDKDRVRNFYKNCIY